MEDKLDCIDAPHPLLPLRDESVRGEVLVPLRFPKTLSRAAVLAPRGHRAVVAPPLGDLPPPPTRAPNSAVQSRPRLGVASGPSKRSVAAGVSPDVLLHLGGQQTGPIARAGSIGLPPTAAA